MFRALIRRAGRAVVSLAAVSVGTTAFSEASDVVPCFEGVAEPAEPGAIPSVGRYAILRAEGIGVDRKAELSTFSSMIEDFDRKTCRLVILGETHGDQVAHLLEKMVFENLSRDSTAENAKSCPQCILSMEMFEVDKQLVLDEYLNGAIPEHVMLKECNAWDNYGDYRPLVEHAKAKNIPIIAANAPQRYVSMVSQKGQEALVKLPKSSISNFLPPLPIQDPSETLCYKMMLFMKANMRKDPRTDAQNCPAYEEASGTGQRVSNPAFDRIVMAQSLWDASMAWRLAQTLSSKEEIGKIVHVCGRFHVEHGLGIPEHLESYLRSNHCEQSLRTMTNPGDAFRAVARTAVFIPAEIDDDGVCHTAVAGVASTTNPLLVHAADWIILTVSPSKPIKLCNKVVPFVLEGGERKGEIRARATGVTPRPPQTCK